MYLSRERERERETKGQSFYFVKKITSFKFLAQKIQKANKTHDEYEINVFALLLLFELTERPFTHSLLKQKPKL
jgi:hypothetical protein